MSIYQDHFAGLSELERLAAMAADPERVHELGADQWPLAMMAVGLMTCNDETKRAENNRIYGIFMEKCPVAARRGSLPNLARFITGRKGEGWQALLPYAGVEQDAATAAKAALLIATLAKPDKDTPLAGVRAVVDLLCHAESCTAGPLIAILSLADMRVLPLLRPLLTLPQERLAELIAPLSGAANRLSCTWLAEVITTYPALAPAVVPALARLLAKAPTVLDVAMPIPTWAYTNPAPQPLHGWTPAEYYSRLLPTLSPLLSPEQLALLRTACRVS